MSTPMLSIEADGGERWRRRMAGLTRKLDDFSQLGAHLDPVIYGHLKGWFDSEGDGTWEPLSPKYAAWKARFSAGDRILVDTGDLKDSMTNADGRFSIRRVDRHGGEWGTNRPGAASHNNPRRKGVPRRRIIVLNNEFRKDFLAVVRDYTHGLMVKRGGL